MIYYRHFMEDGIGIAMTIEEDGYKFGLAKTHPKDQYCKATARKLTTERLETSPNFLPLDTLRGMYIDQASFLGFTPAGIEKLLENLETRDFDLQFVYHNITKLLHA